MKRIYTTAIIIVLLSTNICYAKTPNEYLKDISYIDSQLSIIINKIVDNDYKDIKPIEKDLIFLESLLSSIGSEIDTGYKQASSYEDKSFFLNIDNITNNYELSTYNIRRYFSGKKVSQTFIDVVDAYSSGHKGLIYLQERIKKG